MDLKQKSTEVIETLTVSYFADVHLNEDWDDLKWDILDVIAHVPRYHGLATTKTLGFAVHDEDESYYFATTIIYETPSDVVVFEIYEIDVDMFLDFVNEGDWINC